MNPHEQAKHIRTLMERIWNEGDLGAVRELCRENMVLHCPHCNRLSGVPSYQEYAARVLGMFPDLHVQFHEVVVSEDRVTLRYSWSGTFAGGQTAMGFAPAGRQVMVEGVALYHLVDDQIVVGWASEDWLSMYEQLGLLSAEEKRAA